MLQKKPAILELLQHFNNPAVQYLIVFDGQSQDKTQSCIKA
jgi:hypothetical protein